MRGARAQAAWRPARDHPERLLPDLDGNDVSSRALVGEALPFVQGEGLDVLIGGLGLGYALDEALASDRVASVRVVEIEPAVVGWFRQHGDERAACAAEGEQAGRASIIVGDVARVLAERPAAFDLVCLDTDNGPEWLVRDENAASYASGGIALVRRALRPGGAAVFWSPDRYPAFRRRLLGAFPRVAERLVHDTVDGRRHEYVMYVAVVEHELRGQRRGSGERAAEGVPACRRGRLTGD